MRLGASAGAIVASFAMAVAAAYVPPHMQLPPTWTDADVSAGTVSASPPGRNPERRRV